MPTTTENHRTEDDVRRASNLASAWLPFALFNPTALVEAFFDLLEELLSIQRRYVDEVIAAYRALLTRAL